MVEQSPVRVLWQFTMGVPWLSLTEQEKQAGMEQFTELVKKWQANGVKILGHFSGFGATNTGFVHTVMLDVPSLDQLDKMNHELFHGLQKHMEKVSWTVGERGIVETW